MRCMLTSNVSVENMFANGSQGRLLQWQPEKTEKKAFLASHPDLQARFLKEGSMKKQTFLADVDFIDCSIRPESLTAVPGAPTMLQLPLLASYALTIHKTQATVHGLSIASPLPLPSIPGVVVSYLLFEPPTGSRSNILFAVLSKVSSHRGKSMSLYRE